MVQPSSKSPELEAFLDNYSLQAFGRKRTEAIKGNICVRCGQTVKAFRTPSDESEYAISGFCQMCQDESFSND